MSSIKTKENIEAIYPLTPMQEGMLFHYLSEPDSGAYFEQYTCSYIGAVDSEALNRAWQKVVDHYAILRTLVIWERKDRPLQIVRKHADLEWHEEDLSIDDEDISKKKLNCFLKQDINRGFNLKQAPLMRIALFKMSDIEYRFVWSFHHLLLDGWSSPLLFNNVFNLYEAYKQGKDLDIKQTPPFQNYISWLQKQEAVEAEDYWTEYLSGFCAPTKLQLSSPLSDSRKPSCYEKLSVNLNPKMAVALRSLVRKHQLTLNTLVQGAWAYLLSCYSGEKDVMFGSTVSGRPAELKGVVEMVGLFINTLPVRVKIDTRVSVFKWLKNLQSRQLESKDFEYSSLVEIHKWSEIPRREGLFESILIFENYPTIEAKERSLGFTINNEHTREQTNYPLTIGVEPDNNFLLNCIFDCTCYDATTISRLLEHFKIILENIARNPSKSINYQSILTEEENRLLRSWNQTESNNPNDIGVHQLVEEQVVLRPDKVAVSFNQENISFNDLDIKANKLAHYLISSGVKKGDLVGLCVARSIEMIVCILAVQKAGAAYLPLDPEYPNERIKFILNDAKIILLLTESQFDFHLSKCSETLILIDKEANAIGACDDKTPEIKVNGLDVAYVIYTSGSTGRPKGVRVPHSSVVNFLLSMKNKPGLTQDDRLLAVTTLAFDIAVLELFLPLITGARVVLADRESVLDGEALLKTIEKANITIMQATPATWRLMLAAGWEKPLEPVSKLKILCGGEAMPEDLVEPLLARSESLWNMYGPTETTVWSTLFQIEGSSKRILIGKPIANTKIHVLDHNKEEQIIGVSGELYISGAGVTLGYLNREELTAERYIEHPLGRLYRTGDLVRHQPDGNLEYVNRLDNQVKVRGFRIELGEVEFFLSSHSSIYQSVVVIREDQPGDSRLVAYYVSKDDELSVTQLRKYLRSHLPNYMIPQHFVTMKELPVTANKKIDRKALPEPFNSGVGTDQFQPARTDNEKLLVMIWQDVLKIDKVGINDNFFDLGGHSLLSMQVITRLKDETGLKLELRAMVLDTLEQIAAQYPEVEVVDDSGTSDVSDTKKGFLRNLKQRFIPKKMSN